MSLCEFVFDPSEPHLQGLSDDINIPPGFWFTHHDVSKSNAVYTLDTEDTFILIWGDPSQHHRDNTISVLLMDRVFSSHWGRSWICYCKKTNQLFGAVDKLGLFPIFHNRTGSKHILCSNRQLMAKRLGPDCSVNTQGVIELLAYGQLFNEVSILLGVTQLKAGRTFQINASDGFIQQTPEKLAFLSNSYTSFNNSVDVFKYAVSQCFEGPNRPIISLSAGLDSRLILAAALNQGLRPICLGYGESNSTDMIVASQIAEQFKLPFFRAGLSSSGRGWEIARRVARLGGGEVPTQHGHALLDENLLSITQGRSIITGTGGECYRAFYYDRGMPGYGLFSNALLRNKLVPHATRYINQEFGKLGAPFFNAFPELKPTLESTLSNVLKSYEVEAQTATEYMDRVYF